MVANLGEQFDRCITDTFQGRQRLVYHKFQDQACVIVVLGNI
jgi:hypothetical protein